MFWRRCLKEVVNRETKGHLLAPAADRGSFRGGRKGAASRGKILDFIDSFIIKFIILRSIGGLSLHSWFVEAVAAIPKLGIHGFSRVRYTARPNVDVTTGLCAGSYFYVLIANLDVLKC